MEKARNCPNHSNRKVLLTCSLCEVEFCEDCLYEVDSLVCCYPHYKQYIEEQWVPAKKIFCSNDENSEGLTLLTKKKELWFLQNIPTFFTHNYSLCKESGDPLSFVTFFCLSHDLKRVQSFIDKKNQSNAE